MCVCFAQSFYFNVKIACWNCLPPSLVPPSRSQNCLHRTRLVRLSLFLILFSLNSPLFILHDINWWQLSDQQQQWEGNRQGKLRSRFILPCIFLRNVPPTSINSGVNSSQCDRAFIGSQFFTRLELWILTAVHLSKCLLVTEGLLAYG